MAELNPQLDDNINYGSHEKKDVPCRCNVIKIKNEHKWTANVSFVPFKNGQRDRAYRNWVRVFLRARKIKNKKDN